MRRMIIMILCIAASFSQNLATALYSTATNELITVNTLQALKPYLDDDNVNVKLLPGIYSITVEDIENGLYPDDVIIGTGVSKALLVFNGNCSTYDFSGVTINVDTKAFGSMGNFDAREIQITGSQNVLKGLTLTDVGSVYDRPTKRGTNIVIDGAYNRIEGFNMTIKGSQPYGYGDAFGKGGSFTIKHYKRCALLIRGESNHVKNCTLIHRSFGHAIFMQAANNPLIEGCYVEGEVRTTDDMLAEEGTGTAADNIDFMTVWGYPLPAGYMLSLGEGGVRAYNAGQTIIDGVEYSRGTSNPTVINCTIKHMRTGITLAHAKGKKYVEGCTAIGCEQAFGLGTEGQLVNCKADAAFGQVYKSTYNTTRDFDANITIIPPVDAYYNGANCLAYIGGSGHRIILNIEDSILNPNLTIQMGGNLKGIRFYSGEESSQNFHEARNISLFNFTGYPVDLPELSYDNDILSCGEVVNNGSNNQLKPCSGCISYPNLRFVKMNAPGFAIDGGSGGINGQTLELYTNIDHHNLTWTEVYRGDGYYSYQKLNTNYCIDGGNGGADGQDVYLWECGADNYNQHWKKIEVSNGNYRLEKRNAAGFSIGLSGIDSVNQNVHLVASDDTAANQHWLIDFSSNNPPVETPVIDSVFVNPATCAATNGSITLSASNIEDGIYEVNYNGGTINSVVFSAGKATINNVAPGNYSDISVKANNCQSLEFPQAIIHQPASIASLSANLSNCFNSMTNVNVSPAAFLEYTFFKDANLNGVPETTELIQTGSSESLSGLFMDEDVVGVMVTDYNNCTSTFIIEIKPISYTFEENSELTGIETGTNYYETDGIIESVQQIDTAAIITYNAAKEVSLFNGFEASAGADFEALVYGCSN